jgi:dihydrofolate reductase
VTANGASAQRWPRVSIIVAYAANRVIGKDGRIPWHLSNDLKRFRQLTMGHHIVMGRKTWESIGRILPGRHHVIISRQPSYKVPGARVVESVEAALEAAKSDSEIFVIGGAEIYEAAMPYVDRILATEIDRTFDGSVRFPDIDSEDWNLISREDHHDEASGLRYRYVNLERKS